MLVTTIAMRPRILSDGSPTSRRDNSNNDGVVTSRLQVLLVEDDEADAYLIKRALSDNPKVGEIVHARDGIEALELIDAGKLRPGLAIVDLHMPRKDGFSLLSEMTARVTVEFPAVVLTSSRSGADQLRSRKRGAARYITKPNSIEKMKLALDQIIEAV